MKTTFLALMALLTAPEGPPAKNWCHVGQTVIIPDGREGPVLLVEGDTCGVMAYGEEYIYRWAYYLIEPAHPKYGR